MNEGSPAVSRLLESVRTQKPIHVSIGIAAHLRRRNQGTNNARGCARLQKISQRPTMQGFGVEKKNCTCLGMIWLLQNFDSYNLLCKNRTQNWLSYSKLRSAKSAIRLFASLFESVFSG